MEVSCRLVRSLLLVCSAVVSPVGKMTSYPVLGTIPPCQLAVSDQLSLLLGLPVSPPFQVAVETASAVRTTEFPLVPPW